MTAEGHHWRKQAEVVTGAARQAAVSLGQSRGVVEAMLTRLATAKSLGELADLSRFLFEAKARLLQVTLTSRRPNHLLLTTCYYSLLLTTTHYSLLLTTHYFLLQVEEDLKKQHIAPPPPPAAPSPSRAYAAPPPAFGAAGGDYYGAAGGGYGGGGSCAVNQPYPSGGGGAAQQQPRGARNTRTTGPAVAPPDSLASQRGGYGRAPREASRSPDRRDSYGQQPAARDPSRSPPRARRDGSRTPPPGGRSRASSKSPSRAPPATQFQAAARKGKGSVALSDEPPIGASPGELRVWKVKRGLIDPPGKAGAKAVGSGYAAARGRS